MAKTHVTMKVNGAEVEGLVEPRTLLVHFIRENLQLTGTHIGCETTHCGACTVDIDGMAVRSCQVTIAVVEGRFITTIEGLSADRSHPVQEAWAAQSVPQCGYCQSGMIMAVSALLKTNPHPSDDDLSAAITNICRCGTYPRIRAAVRTLAGKA